MHINHGMPCNREIVLQHVLEIIVEWIQHDLVGAVADHIFIPIPCNVPYIEFRHAGKLTVCKVVLVQCSTNGQYIGTDFGEIMVQSDL